MRLGNLLKRLRKERGYMKTFDIKQELFALRELLEQEDIDPETGEVFDNSESIKQLSDELEVEIDDKLEGIEYIKREYKATEQMLASEIKRLQERKAMMARKQEQLKKLQDFILSGEKRKTDKFTFYYSSSESVNLFDESEVPSDYFKFEPKIDKTAIKKALKSGESVPGAELETKFNLAVR